MREHKLRQNLNKEWIIDTIQNYVVHSPKNRFPFYDSPIWEKPLVGFSSGADELYQFYKKDIGDFYQTPVEVFSEAFPGTDVPAEDLTVISWILPQSTYTKEQHRRESKMPSHAWVYCRMYGEEINKALCSYMVEQLALKGVVATSPYLNNPRWQRMVSDKYGESGTWSERHAAHVSGLGTFSLTDALITPVGMAVRIGSMIAKGAWEPTLRPYRSHNEYCLFYHDAKCTACISRCPVDAITEQGHDKWKCKAYGREQCKPYSMENYHLEIHSCGLCQVDVPCESCIPKLP